MGSNKNHNSDLLNLRKKLFFTEHQHADKL